MDFTLDEAQQDVRDLVVGLLDKRLADEPSQAPTGADWFHRELWEDLAAAGLVGIALPEKFGGSGAGHLEACVVLEELSRRAARVPFLDSAVLAAGVVAAHGTPEQQARLLPGFCDGSLLLSAAVTTEPHRPVTLQATRTAGGVTLTGAIGHVPVVDAAHRVLVSAHTTEGASGWYLLDPRAEGVHATAQSSVDRAGRTHLELTDVFVPETDALVGDEVTTWLRQHAVSARSIGMVGAADAMISATATHVTEREQFGRPVGTFQAVAHRVADAFLDATAVRLTAWRAAWLLANPDDHTDDVEGALALAAWWATDAPTRIADAAMHLHGGISVDLDYPLHRHYLAIRHGELALGGPARRLAALGEHHLEGATR